jgi:hypothetical protein
VPVFCGHLSTRYKLGRRVGHLHDDMHQRHFCVHLCLPGGGGGSGTWGAVTRPAICPSCQYVAIGGWACCFLMRNAILCRPLLHFPDLFGRQPSCGSVYSLVVVEMRLVTQCCRSACTSCFPCLALGACAQWISRTTATTTSSPRARPTCTRWCKTQDVSARELFDAGEGRCTTTLPR